MNYIQVTFNVDEGNAREMLIAVLADEGFEGFEEIERGLIASILEDQFLPDRIKELATTDQIVYTVKTVPQQNWNAIWESDFQPVVVDGFCTVRASFHKEATDTPYEVIITPKMSFGTGHHATTQLMIEAMRTIDFKGKRVFDFGTGTGILAILAKKLGADYVFGIDNDEWAVPNSIENADMNNCELDIRQGSLENFPPAKFDVILANINRNILLHYMPDLFHQMALGGWLLLSGILLEDEDAIVEKAEKSGFRKVETRSLNGWMTILLNAE